jgi:hypothetical protein
MNTNHQDSKCCSECGDTLTGPSFPMPGTTDFCGQCYGFVDGVYVGE